MYSMTGAVAYLISPLPPCNSLPAKFDGSRRHTRPPCLCCAKGVTANPDDYHATVKALNSRGRVPRKSLGQHYMLSNNINEQLVAAAGVKEGDVVMEIGPGTGSLTNVLINAGATVLAIEKDPNMVYLVSERLAGNDQLKVLQEGFVRCYVRSHMSSFLESLNLNETSRYAKVVANIPFNMSTDVVKQLLPMGSSLKLFYYSITSSMEETAVRLVLSSSGTSQYRPINIFTNFYLVPKYIINVPRANFFPQPNVDAAVVTLKLKKENDYPPVTSIKSFFSMVNSAFNDKRKMLRKSLQHLTAAANIEKALTDIGLPVTSRPEDLTMDEFVKLHSLVTTIGEIFNLWCKCNSQS